MKPRLTDKLDKLRADPGCGAFILADARDADMAWGVPGPGPADPARGPAGGYLPMPRFREQVRETVRQGLVDIMLASTSTMSVLAHGEKLFAHSDVTPAVRINDTSDIWAMRGGCYPTRPSTPFATSRIEEAQFGSLTADDTREPVVNLGLYSVTFNNDLDADHRTLSAFNAFREKAERAGFHYFLEVFPPNVAGAVDPRHVAGFVNDHICRMLAGVALPGRPAFLKMPFLGAAALEELVGYDPSMVVGVMGGGSGTTHDAFTLLETARRHGARAALFGRKIKDADDPMSMVVCLRRIADGELTAREAVRLYHDLLDKARVKPRRPLMKDQLLTDPALRRAGE